MDLFTTITYSISTSSDLSEFLPLAGWLFFARHKKEFFILGLFFLISASIKLFTLFSAVYYINNMPAFHLLAPIEVVMVYWFYAGLFDLKVKYWIVGILVCLNLANTFFCQKISTFNSLSWSINMIIILVIGLAYVFKLHARDDEEVPFEKKPSFIITVGWLVYAAGSTFTYIMGSSILSGKAEGFYHNAWIFQCLSNLSKNVIISYGLWKAR